ncbi:MAG: hypothetical protein ACRD82_18655 [Blastocatellia bacterium]
MGFRQLEGRHCGTAKDFREVQMAIAFRLWPFETMTVRCREHNCSLTYSISAKIFLVIALKLLLPLTQFPGRRAVYQQHFVLSHSGFRHELIATKDPLQKMKSANSHQNKLAG